MKRNLEINNQGQISIDFLTAIGIFLLTFFFIIYSLTGVTTTYQRKDANYPPAERLSTLLVKNPGLKHNEDTGWEELWDENQSKVARIGLSDQLGEKSPLNYTRNDTPTHYVLNFHKVDGRYNSTLDTEGLMKRHGSNETNYWWELGEKVNKTDYQSFRNSLDLYPQYRLYLQIIPQNTNATLTQPNKNALEYISNTTNTEKIEKIVFIKRYVEEEKEWVFLTNQEGEVIKYSFLLWMW